MSRLNVFREDNIIGGMYKSSLASLGFVPGYIPSSEEIDEAYVQRREYLANTTILDQLYATLHQPIYRYERVYERIQYQYLLKQYDVLYKYYNLLEKEGLNKDSEKLLNSYEEEYEKCLTDIRHIETESNIVAELITNGIDNNILDSFISGLEKRNINEKFNIDNSQLSIKISDLKRKISDLYYEQSSKSRIDIKKDYISRITVFNDIAKRYPNTEEIINTYLNSQTKIIVVDDIELSERRNHLNDISFISSFLTHPTNGNSNISKEELTTKLNEIKHKADLTLKQKKLDYMKLFKERIFNVDYNSYTSNLDNYETALKRLDDKNILFNTYINIVGTIIDSEKLTSEDITYLDGLLNSFNKYLDGIKVSNEKVEDIDSVLAQEQTELSSFCIFKERSINENIMLRYVSLKNQITSYYDQLFIPNDNRTNIYKLLSNYGNLLKDNTVSLKNKLATIDYLTDFANTYCSGNTLKRNRPLA
mgnify:FL=1